MPTLIKPESGENLPIVYSAECRPDHLVDMVRVMEAGVRDFDDSRDGSVAVAMNAIGNVYGRKAANFAFVFTVCKMIDQEDFSFIPRG